MNSITQIGTNFINNILEYFFSGGDILTIEQMEHDLLPMMKKAASQLASEYINNANVRLNDDKAGRKEVGYSIVRHGDERRVLTAFGELVYERTYYAHKDCGHAYLVDMLIGLDKYDRISDGVSVALAEAACEMSYAKSSNYTVDGAVSRQTVMKRVRACSAKKPEINEKRKVAALHIDADEAHVKLLGGKKAIVPLISVYEGIKVNGKRRSCINVFHISEYGKKTDDLWAQALDEVMARYDLEDTKVYIHGDGAKWIQQGLYWFTGATFVLDKYHKNKSIKAMIAGLDKDARNLFGKEIQNSLRDKDVRFFGELSESLVNQLPNRKDKIAEAAKYLLNNIDAIHICKTDPEANNGGCTEPHVAHVLSRRLSTLPMAWSQKTLKQLAPMLASGGKVELHRQKHNQIVERMLKRAARGARKATKKYKFAPNPESIGVLMPISNGKVNQLYRTLNSLSQGNFS